MALADAREAAMTALAKSWRREQSGRHYDSPKLHRRQIEARVRLRLRYFPARGGR
jgi:hypothetical protein